jgi:hypothetical protein
MAQFDETNTPQPATETQLGMIPTVAFCILAAFFAMVMMMVEGGGPQTLTERGTALSCGALVLGAAVCLPGIYKKGGPMAFVSAGLLSASVLALAAATFAFF